MGDKYIDKQLKSYFRENKLPTCILSPSYHRKHPEKSFYTNESIILVNVDKEIKTYQLIKDTPFESSDKGIVEGIQGEGINLIIIHIREYIRIAFVICKDYISDNYKKIIYQIMHDFVIIQSYTSSLSLFDNFIGYYNSQSIYSILGNACSAVESNNNQMHAVYVVSVTDRKNELKYKKFEIDCFDDCQRCSKCYFFDSFHIGDDNHVSRIERKGGTHLKE